MALEFDQPVIWDNGLTGQIYVNDEAGKVVAGSLKGNVLTLKLKDVTDPTKISYLKEMKWSQESLLMGANGIAALTFCDVPILPESSRSK